MANQIRALLVDDQLLDQKEFAKILTTLECNVTTAGSGPEALKLIQQKPTNFDIVFTDLMMPEMNGLELTRKIKSLAPHIDVVVVTATATIDTAIEAIQAGAANYLTKPVALNQVKKRIDAVQEKLLQQSHKKETHKDLKENIQLVCKSPKMKKIVDDIARVVRKDSTVLITGETGTGKEVIAKYIHQNSPRADGPFLAVNCSAIPENLLESEFFGHEKGAFTGADKAVKGFFEKANGGTLFLDEIGEMDIKLQPKILRAIEERKIRTVGGSIDIPVDIRLIAATHRDLHQKVAQGQFREDLFYRINVVHVELPALRERTEDMAELVDQLVTRFSQKLNIPIPKIDPLFIEALKEKSFKGNVRELANLIERSLLYLNGDTLDPSSLPVESARQKPPIVAGLESSEITSGQRRALSELVSTYEKNLIESALQQNKGNIAQIATDLGVSRATLYSKIAKYGIKT